MPGEKTSSYRGIRASIWIAFVLLAFDVVLSGSFLWSLLVCPIWFLVSLFKNTIQRPGWRLALVRIAIPALTLALVLANNDIQSRIADTNAQRVIEACEEFHAANGRFPKTLDELVPRYTASIPRAKYCLTYGHFLYLNSGGEPLLVWYAVPPFGREVYSFKKQQWSYID